MYDKNKDKIANEMKYKKCQTTLILGFEGACCVDFWGFFLSSTLS